jgi:hypothetical protein
MADDAADDSTTQIAVGGQPDDAGASDGGALDSGANSGVVCVGDRIVTTDQQYQSLLAEHCSELTGGLHIFTTGAPATAPGLDELTKIGGDLRVHSVPGLKSMTPFSHVESVGGSLAIYSNTEMESLDGLERLRSVGQAVQLNSTNTSLASVAGLANLETVGESFTLYAPATSLEGWHLKSVRYSFFIAGTHLTSLAGLEHVTSLGAFVVSHNDDLSSLAPLLVWPKGAVGASLSVDNNPKLPQCQVDSFVTAQGIACPGCVGNNPSCN